VARLAARLDGMPLAIELAAARAETLGVTQLLDRIDDRFALLAGADRLAPDRQRSLAATVEWSYRLLDETGRRAWGPWYLDACGHLCAATGRPAEAVTMWAAHAALITREDWPGSARRREEPLRAARQALGPARVRAAEQRGTAMSLSAAAEYFFG
jgi:hypothetical protein